MESVPDTRPRGCVIYPTVVTVIWGFSVLTVFHPSRIKAFSMNTSYCSPNQKPVVLYLHCFPLQKPFTLPAHRYCCCCLVPTAVTGGGRRPSGRRRAPSCGRPEMSNAVYGLCVLSVLLYSLPCGLLLFLEQLGCVVMRLGRCYLS